MLTKEEGQGGVDFALADRAAQNLLESLVTGPLSMQRTGGAASFDESLLRFTQEASYDFYREVGEIVVTFSEEGHPLSFVDKNRLESDAPPRRLTLAEITRICETAGLHGPDAKFSVVGSQAAKGEVPPSRLLEVVMKQPSRPRHVTFVVHTGLGLAARFDVRSAD